MKPYTITLLQLFLTYILLCLIIYLIQSHLIYFPRTVPDYDKNMWTVVKDNQRIIGLQTKQNYDNVVVVFHGNAGSANKRAYYRHIIPENYNLIVVEYPGFGLNHEGTANKENIIEQARYAMKYIQSKHPKNLYMIGESLGSGVASQMASEFNVSKLLLTTPFSSLKDVAQSKFWFLPVGLLLNNNYDNINSLKNYKGEVLIVMANEDKVIPIKYTLKLAESLKTKPMIIEKANHNEWLAYISDEQFDELKRFLQ